MLAVIRVIDFESTGPRPPEHGLCEIGYIDLEAQALDLAGRPTDWTIGAGQAWLVNPGCNIPPLTSAVHHIVDEDVRMAPNWRATLRTLMASTAANQKIIALAAHGADSEKTWFDDDIVAPVPWIDTYKAALRVWPQASTHSNQGLRYDRRPVGLDKARAHPTHRALPDAYVTAFLLRDLLETGCSIEQMIEWAKIPALTVRCFIGKFRNDGAGTPWPEVDSGMLRWILEKDFSDKPDVVFTVRHHLKLRAEQVRLATEQMDLNRQLVAAGLPEEPIEPSGARELLEERARLGTSDTNQGFLLL